MLGPLPVRTSSFYFFFLARVGGREVTIDGTLEHFNFPANFCYFHNGGGGKEGIRVVFKKKISHFLTILAIFSCFAKLFVTFTIKVGRGPNLKKKSSNFIHYFRQFENPSEFCL